MDMNINVILYGIAREIVGTSKITIDLEKGATVSQFKSKLVGEYPKMSSLKSLSLAVDTTYVSDEHILKENEEVIIIPPVSGG